MDIVSKPYIPVFLLGGGEMGERIRDFDWSKTPLGDPENWEQSLKTCVRIMLSSSQPIWIGWGKDLIKLYNDPYRSIVGGKHPDALGQPVSFVWKDIWTDIEPLLTKVMQEDEGVYVESQLLIMERYGYPEETYYTFSYTPIPGDNGITSGVLCANTDDTSRAINERALETLRKLGKISYKEKTFGEIYRKTAAVLAENNKDFPFACFYKIKENEAKAVALAGDKSGCGFVPQLININEPNDNTRDICKAIKTNENVLVDNNGRRSNMPKGFWDIVSKQILHIPLCIPNTNCPNAVLTIGLNPYRKYDTVYQTFIELLTDQIMLDTNNIHAMEEERKRASEKNLKLVDVLAKQTADLIERKQAEEKIKESEKKYRELVTSLPVAVYTCDAEGKILFYNEIAATLWGYTPDIADESLKFCACYKVWMMDGAFVPPEQTPMALALKTGQSFRNVEAMVQRPDGEKFYAGINIDPLFDEKGTVKGAINIFQDITNVKHAEIALRDNEERYKNLINGLPVAFYTTDQNGALTLYNQAATELWGRFPQIGKDMWCGSWKIFEADGVTEVALDECPMAVCLKEKRKVVPDNYFIVERPDGTRRYFQPFAEPMYNLQGEMIGGTNTLIDLTEQILARKKIEESEKRFRLLAESLPQLVWVTDEKGKREFISQEWQQYTGVPPALIDEKWPSIVHPDDLESTTQKWTDSLTAGNSYKTEVRLKGKAGEFRWHTVIGVPVFDHENRIIKWIGAFTDIDIMKREQQRKDAFMSMASHELKTPITTIKAYGEIAEMMLEKKGDKETLAIQKKMSKQVNKLTTLVTDLLDNIRIRNGKLMYAEAFYNFNELVHEVIDDLQKINPAYKINVKEGQEITVFGDKEKIGQVINNLITNAQKYSPGTSEIIVTIEVSAEGVQLSVKDFGIGISPAEHQHIFEQFYRVNGESQSTFPGMGIGLYICAEIISRQGGKIWVESAIGQGSTFYIRLPLDNSTGNRPDKFFQPAV